MKILSKKQVKNAQESENERLVQKGLRIAEAVDDMEKKYRETKKAYEEMIDEKKNEMSKTILELQKEITALRNERDNLIKKSNA